MRMFIWIRGILLAHLRGSSDARAEAHDLDMTCRTGISGGSITYTDDTGEEVTGNYGGIPIGVVWNRGFSRSMSLLLSGGVLLDLINSQLIKQGFAGGVAWHVLGGPRTYSLGGTELGVISRTASSLSLVTYGGIQNFAATDTNDPTLQVSGSVFEVDIGIEYRHDLSDEDAATFEVMTSVFSLPASTSRIKPSSLEILFGWRTYI